jgi:AcrR family transcriptional regulator
MQSPPEISDWRERRRVSLRGGILTSAEALIRSTRSTDFTMRELVEKAGVALATPYSLIGSKAAVLYALMEQGIQSIDVLSERRAVSDAIDGLLSVAEVAADFYGRDPVLYRPLLRFLFGADEPQHHPMLFSRAMALWDPAIDQSIRDGLLLPGVRAIPLKRLLMVNFIGALQFWIQEELDGPGLRNQVLYGMVLQLIPQVRETRRKALEERLVRLTRQQPRHLVMRRAPPRRPILPGRLFPHSGSRARTGVARPAPAPGPTRTAGRASPPPFATRCPLP